MKKNHQSIRIAIDGRFFGPRQKGLGRYVQRLVEELDQITKGELRIKNYEFIIFLRKKNWDEYQPKNHRFKKVLADYRWYSLKEQIFFPFKIWRERIDLIHFPHFNVPVFCPVPFVVTIHDLVLRRFPTRRASTLSPFLYWIKNLAYRLVIWLAVKRARKVIAVSNFTKQDILHYFKINPEKVIVIYEGSPLRKKLDTEEDFSNKTKNSFFVLNGTKSCQDDKAGQNRESYRALKIKSPYLLYVGNAYPHKNLERLILAFQDLVLKDKLDFCLVLVGELDYFYQRLKKMVSILPFQVREKIVFTDFVDDQVLVSLYQNAEVYVFPSLCEGFGLPPLEAMSWGLPVICAQAGSLPEILGEAAIYFRPEKIEDIRKKIKLVLNSQTIREKLIKQGYAQIKKYSWLKMAQETLRIYQDMVK